MQVLIDGRVHTPPKKRYNVITIGIVESLNVVLKNARDLPILQLVEELRNLLQKWFANRKKQALSMKTKLTTWLIESFM